MGFRKFHKESNTVEIPFDRYEKLILAEKKYDMVVYALQSIGAENERYVHIKETNMILNILGEDVLTYQGEEKAR